MNKLFAAYIFILLDININIGGSILGLLPDFVGYILLVKATEELLEENNKFESLRPVASTMAVFSALVYTMALVGVFAELKWLRIVLELAELVLSLGIAFVVIAYINGIEYFHRSNFQTEKLTKALKVVCAADAGSFILRSIGIIRAVAFILSFAAGIFYLTFLYRTKELYYDDSNVL